MKCTQAVQAAVAAKLARMLTNETIRAAVELWCDPNTRPEIVEKYGVIGEWDVSGVTDMSRLFRGRHEFNDDISSWDTANVVNMSFMFSNASSFNQPVEGLDTANVTTMGSMFSGASSFNQPVEGLDTANVVSMRSMFSGAS